MQWVLLLFRLKELFRFPQIVFYASIKEILYFILKRVQRKAKIMLKSFSACALVSNVTLDCI